MAQSSCAQTAVPVYTLVVQLNAEEREMLKAMVQNHTGEAEPALASHIREVMFNALNKVV